MGWSSRPPGGLGAQFRESGHGLPRSPLPPAGRGSSSGSWPWPRSCGGPGKAWESKPALAPAARMPQTTRGGRSATFVIVAHSKSFSSRRLFETNGVVFNSEDVN